MTDEEIINYYNIMRVVYGDELPDPDHEPIRFAYFVKLFKYYHDNK